MKRLSLAVLIAVVLSLCLTSRVFAFADILVKLGIDAGVALLDTGYKKITTPNSTETATTVSNEPQWQQAIRTKLTASGIQVKSFEDKIIFPNRIMYVMSSEQGGRRLILYTANPPEYVIYGVSDGAELKEVQEAKSKPEKEKMLILANGFRKYTSTHVNLLPSTDDEVKAEAARGFKTKNGSELVFLGTNETVQINADYSAQAFYGVGNGETLIVVATQDSAGKLTGHYVVVNQLTFAQMGEDKVLMAKTFNEQTNLKLEVEPQAKELAKLE